MALQINGFSWGSFTLLMEVTSPFIYIYMVYRVPSCRNPFSENPYLRPFSNADGLEDELPGFPFKRPG